MDIIKKQKLQVLKFKAKQGETTEFNANTKTEHDTVLGIFVRLSNSEALQGATIRIWVDETEVIPNDTEVALLHHSDDMSISDVKYPVHEKAKNSTVKIIYKDDSDNLANAEEYDVRVYIIAEVSVKQ